MRSQVGCLHLQRAAEVVHLLPKSCALFLLVKQLQLLKKKSVKPIFIYQFRITWFTSDELYGLFLFAF